MQLIVNGSQTHVLEVAPEANVAQLRAQLSMLEGVDCEQVCPLQLAPRSVLSLASYSAEPVLLRLPPRGRGQPRRPGESDRRPDRAPARRKGPRFPGPCWQSEGTDPQGKVTRNSYCLHILFILTLKLAMMIYPCTTPTEMRRNLPLTF